MKLAVGIVCWIETNEQLPELKRCLDSVKDFDVIVVNGKWKHMPGDNQHSTKEARQLIESYPNVIHRLHDGLLEYEARNIYLNLAQDMGYNYLLMLDSDEWLIKMDDIHTTRPLNYIRGYSPIHGGNIIAMKLIRTDVRHNIRHNRYFIGDEEITKDVADPSNDIFIRHEKNYRPERVQNNMEEMRRRNPEN